MQLVEMRSLVTDPRGFNEGDDNAAVVSRSTYCDAKEEVTAANGFGVKGQTNKGSGARVTAITSDNALGHEGPIAPARAAHAVAALYEEASCRGQAAVTPGSEGPQASVGRPTGGAGGRRDGDGRRSAPRPGWADAAGGGESPSAVATWLYAGGAVDGRKSAPAAPRCCTNTAMTT
ncbi:unnamed protein product [Lampetra planeri]